MPSLFKADKPLIVVIGSADASRTDYDPPLALVPQAAGAAEDIGGALAKAGCRLIVFSSDPAYLEKDFVQGFVKNAPKDASRLIQVRAPQGAAGATFPVPATRAGLFDLKPDSASHWVASYYGALRDADGLVIIGGGRAALISGHLALSMKIPLLTLTCFGGSGRKVWHSVKPGIHLASQDEVDAMGRPDWQPAYAAPLVKGLVAQIARSTRQERAARAGPNLRAGIGLALVLAITLGLIAANGGTAQAALLFGLGPLAGIAGALARSVWTGSKNSHDYPLPVTVLFGAICGMTASLIYLIAQFTAAGEIDKIKTVALIWIVIIAIGTSFAFEKTFRHWAKDGLKPGGNHDGE